MRIKLNCPRCTEEVPAVWREADQIFTCPSCRTQFTVSRSGRYQIVKKNRIGWPSKAAPGSTSTLSSAEYEQSEALWQQLATRGWFYVIVGGLLLLTALVVWYLRARQSALPTLLTERAELAAQAFLDGDTQTLEALTDPTMRRLVEDWVIRNRPAAWNASPRPLVIRNNTRIYQSDESKTAGIVAHYRYTPPNALPDPKLQADSVDLGASTPSPGTVVNFEILLHWRLDPSGEWLLDINRMLRTQKSVSVVR